MQRFITAENKTAALTGQALNYGSRATMKKPSDRIPPSELTRATTASSKRAHSSTSERSYRRRKRKRTERETLKPDPPLCFSGSNSFHRLRSSSRRCRNQSRTEKAGSANSRRWVYSSHDSSSFKDKVVVVSYNILGVENASNHPDLYFKVPQRFMEWNRRKLLMREEINRYRASILCLQEVDRFNDLDGLLHKDGFKGVYQPRTGEADDGCAIFWKEGLFTLLHQENIEFQSFGLRNNVAQLCVLKMNQNQSELDEHAQPIHQPTQSRSFVIGNIHVLFNPNRGDIKLGQVRLLLEKASKLSQEWGCIPVILCGDLNSIPQSPIYQFIASSKLDIQLHDRRNISGQVEFQSKRRAFGSQNEKASRWSEEEISLATGSGGVTHLQHHLNLCSAYPGVPASCRTRDDCGEPLATSFHSKFMGTVDYIWHTEELVPVKVLETLPVDILKRAGGLPSKKWGSDHLALACELAFVDNCRGD